MSETVILIPGSGHDTAALVDQVSLACALLYGNNRGSGRDTAALANRSPSHGCVYSYTES